MITLLALVSLLLLILAVQFATLYTASRWIRPELATWKRAAAAIALFTLGGITASVVIFRRELRSDPPAAFYGAIFVFLCLFVLLVYERLYRTSFRQLLGFVGVHCLMIVAGVGLWMTFKYYVAEAFVIPANSMAPTLVGQYAASTCPKCGGRVIHSVTEGRDPFHPELAPDEGGMCAACHEYFPLQPIDARAEVHAPDRMLVRKFGEYQRWNMIAFINPQDPDVTYVKRIVGLPGETMELRDDGFAYADGKKLEPPVDLVALRYTSRPGENDPSIRTQYEFIPLQGDPRKPIRLGPDEYFVLGDNTHRSLDGRFWGAVPQGNIIGTAALIYWPPSRWRTFE